MTTYQVFFCKNIANVKLKLITTKTGIEMLRKWLLKCQEFVEIFAKMILLRVRSFINSFIKSLIKWFHSNTCKQVFLRRNPRGDFLSIPCKNLSPELKSISKSISTQKIHMHFFKGIIVGINNSLSNFCIL